MQDQVIGQFNEPICVITMIFKLRTKALFEFLRLRRKSPPNLWQFGLAVQEVIAVRTSLAMTGKLSAAERIAWSRKSDWQSCELIWRAPKRS